MGQALYRRYRSKKLSELVGQEHITTALERALKKGTVSHAYLFTGPRGVGKTSIARILAHEINGLPYDEDATHLDIIEIDAASNRRIDEIRDLRDKVHIAPTSAKYKVYIIDEVHMLTKEAFNALLKTLEEPPAHVIFILATTEVHKLPETIISRTQRFAFKPVELSKVVAHLKHIAKQEKITISDDALELIAEHGEGSFRDSISLLDQVSNTSDKITLPDVQSMLGIAPEKTIQQILGAVQAHDPVATTAALQALKEQGYEPPQVARQLGRQLRDHIVSGKAGLAHDVALALLARLVDVPASRDPRSALEIALLDAALTGKTPETPAEPKIMQQEVAIKPAIQVEPHPSSLRKTTKTDDTPLSSEPLDATVWPKMLQSIKQKHNTLYSVVRTVRPVFGNGEITLECGYAFHKKRLSESRNKQVIMDTVREITGQEVAVQFSVVAGVVPLEAEAPLPAADEKVHEAKPAKKQDSADIKTISNIFGGAELLES
jgi:DNA polymerase-3 subunit gamma/tau